MSPASGWEFRNPTRIVFGGGSIERLTELVSGSMLLVTTPGHSARGLTARVVEMLGGRMVVHDQVEPNPTIDQLVRSGDALRRERIEMVIGLGGGSVLDSAKVLSVTLARPNFDLRAALEGKGGSGSSHRLPMIAVPTTAGTGSEVTPTATVWDAAARRKYALSAPELYPNVAVIDPDLAADLPWKATLGPGLDALCQCVDSIWNRNATAVSTAFATAGISRIPAALRALLRDLRDGDARTAMAEAALLSGLAISQTRTALTHSMSYPLTAHLGLPHGLACGLVLPAVLAYNLEADEDGREELVGLGSGGVLPKEIERLYEDLGVRDAVHAVIGEDPELQGLADEMITPGRADNNIRPVNTDDIRGLLASTEAWLAGTVPA